MPVPGDHEGIQVVNIPPGDGRSGYFKVEFIAPQAFSKVTLSGRANVDDVGRVFVNSLCAIVLFRLGSAASKRDSYRRRCPNVSSWAYCGRPLSQGKGELPFSSRSRRRFRIASYLSLICCIPFTSDAVSRP